MSIDLSVLGITAEELQNKIIDKAVATLLAEDIGYDEDGEECPVESAMRRRVRAAVEQRAEAEVTRIVDKIGDEIVAPKVEALIEGMAFQKTNQWGEAKEPARTWREELIQRAENYLSEQVNYNGKTQKQDPHCWRADSTRIVHMVNKHLQFEIDRAMKDALNDANSKIAGGILAAVKTGLNNVLATLKVSATVKD